MLSRRSHIIMTSMALTYSALSAYGHSWSSAVENGSCTSKYVEIDTEGSERAPSPPLRETRHVYWLITKGCMLQKRVIASY